MVKTMGGNLQSTARPGCLLIAAAIAIPNALTLPDLNDSNSANLVDEDRLSKFLE
jgi:hypothetical protein